MTSLYSGVTTRKPVITLPYKWKPRPYQVPLFTAFDEGIKRAVLVWPRRAGKDTCTINLTMREAFKQRGTYVHCLPTQKQARKVVWESIGKDGVKMLDQAIPPVLRKRTRDADMMIELVNGSVFQCLGSDNYDSLVGTNVAGIVFSEYAIADPRAWDYLRPILAENGGFACFVSTPRGRNHLWRLMQEHQHDPEWFVQKYTARDISHISTETLEKERRSMPAERFEQEYMTSFDAALVGAIYGRYIEKLHVNGAICDVPYDPRYPVETSWDVGVRDATSIWFVQRMPNGSLHVIDHVEERGKGLPYFAGIVHSKGYSYSGHAGPHDLLQPDWTANGATRQSIALNYGIHFTIAPKLPLSDGIEATRARLPMMRFDKTRCARGILALEQYRYDYDETEDENKAKPVHDWTSHAADALRYFCTSPPAVGIAPAWAQEGIMQPGANVFGIRPGQFKDYQNPGLNPAGGPAWASTDGHDFDPLAFMRSQQRQH